MAADDLARILLEKLAARVCKLEAKAESPLVVLNQSSQEFEILLENQKIRTIQAVDECNHLRRLVVETIGQRDQAYDRIESVERMLGAELTLSETRRERIEVLTETIQTLRDRLDMTQMLPS